MNALRPRIGADAFFDRLSSARHRLLLLDYDGTLAPFHEDPRRVRPYPEVCAALRRIAERAATRLVIVSGRRLEDLEPALELLPHHEIWASHGWERSVGGKVTRHVPAGEVRELLGRAALVAQSFTGRGARIERKVASVALHWRGLPDALAGRIRLEAQRLWWPMVRGQLALLPFDGGVELRARGHDKGSAVREAVASCELPVCAYLGDDITDEDAFRAVRPHGLAVLVRELHRSTMADVRLAPPSEVTAFLDRWAETCG
jgi:trehalose-phosphatase